MAEEERRIYMIGGVGSVGKLVAHGLRTLAHPPHITHLVHTQQLLKQWEDSKKVITLQKDGQEVESSGYDMEVMPEYTPGQPSDKNTGSHIQSLLVITKAAYTVPNLIRVAHRLTAESTVCFLQNGMGIVEEVNEKIFPDPKNRPNYMQGIITHGMNTPADILARDPFYAVHGGQGAIYIAKLPRDPPGTQTVAEQAPNADQALGETWPASAKTILQALTASSLLAGKGITSTELIQQQLQKLAVNSIINPLTALLDRPNGTLLQEDAFIETMRLMLSETSEIFAALPELKAVPDVRERLGTEKLEAAVRDVANGTAHNISSMLSDIRIGQQTEIGYINGYIVRRGREVGIEAPTNYAIMQLVVGKQELVIQETRKAQGNKL